MDNDTEKTSKTEFETQAGRSVEEPRLAEEQSGQEQRSAEGLGEQVPHSAVDSDGQELRSATDSSEQALRPAPSLETGLKTAAENGTAELKSVTEKETAELRPEVGEETTEEEIASAFVDPKQEGEALATGVQLATAFPEARDERQAIFSGGESETRNERQAIFSSGAGDNSLSGAQRDEESAIKSGGNSATKDGENRAVESGDGLTAESGKNYAKSRPKSAGKTAKLFAGGGSKKFSKSMLAYAVAGVVVAFGCIALISAMFGPKKSDDEVVAITDLTDEQKQKLKVTDTTKRPATSETEDANNYTEEYKKYLELPEDEKDKLEVIPRKEVVPDEKIDEIKQDTDSDVVAELPEQFDLRDVVDMTVENQGSYGLCWSYASGKALETHMKMRGVDYNPSELQVDFLVSDLMYDGSRKLHNGGTFQQFANAAASIGTISEEEFASLGVDPDGPSNNAAYYDYFKLAENDSPVYITKTVDFPAIVKDAGKVANKTDAEVEEFRDLVKAQIMTNGAIYMVMDTPDNFVFKHEGDETTYFYTPDAEHSNTTRGIHAMAIVGWDDNFSKDRFKGNGTGEGIEKPLHDGAYLVLNSWGEWWGEGGYFWVSYDEYNVEGQLSGVVATTLDDHARRIDTINSPVVREVIEEKLPLYVVEGDNGGKYVTEYALDRVTRLELPSRNLSDSDLRELARVFPNISELLVPENQITDLASLEGFGNLAIIDLAQNNLQDVAALCATDLQLRDLNLSANRVSDVGCLNDRLVSGMSALNISGNAGVTGLEKLTNLIALTADEIGLEDLASIPKGNLLSLSVKNNNIKNLQGLGKGNGQLGGIDLSGNKNLDDLATDQMVYKLTIRDADLADASVLNSANAYVVDASGNKFGDLSGYDNQIVNFLDLSRIRGLTNLSALSGLTGLTLADCGITALTELGRSGVKQLYLENNKIASLDGIDGLADVEVLNLNNNRLGSLRGIEKMKGLVELRADGNQISSLDGISQAAELRALSADDNLISDASELTKIERLYFVSLNRNKLMEIPNFARQSSISLALEGNPIKNPTIPQAAMALNLADCDIQTLDYAAASSLGNITLEGNPNWNDYIGLIIGTLQKERDANAARYLAVSTDYAFSKAELVNLVDSATSLPEDAYWRLNITGSKVNLKRSPSGTVRLVDYPGERVLFMSLLQSGGSSKDFSVDKAATELVLADRNTSSLPLELNAPLVGVEVRANGLTLEFE